METKSVYTFAKWQVKDNELDNVLHLLGDVALKTIEEKGNLFYKVHQSNADAHTLILFEGYIDEAAVEVHRNSAYFQNIVVSQIIPKLDNREVILASLLDLTQQ